jgi:hypothetical protein
MYYLATAVSVAQQFLHGLNTLHYHNIQNTIVALYFMSLNMKVRIRECVHVLAYACISVPAQ